MQPQLKKTLWIVVPSILFLCVVLVFSVIYSISDKSPSATATPAGDNVMRFPEQDFAFVPPPTDSWQQADANKIVPNATLGFARMNPQMAFVVIVSKLPDASMNLNALAQQMANDIQTSFANSNFQIVQQPGQKNINGIQGVAMVHHADAKGVQQTYVHWVGTQRGLAYHLMLIGLTSNESTALSEAENMFGRFHPLSDFPSNQGAAPNSLAEFTSKRYQYVIRFNDPNWRQWPDFAKQADYAELGVLNGNDTCLLTAALNIGDLPSIDFDTLLTSFGRTLGINLNAQNTARLRSNIAEGAVIAFPTGTPNGDLQHIVEIVRLKGTVFIGHAWTSNPQKFPLIRDQLLNNINFSNDPPTNPQMTPEEERVCGRLLNELGITYVRTNRPAQAIPVLERAQQLLPMASVIADNKAVAQLQNAQPRDAQLTINLAMQRFPNEPDLKARAAQINSELGANNVAQTLYADLFNKPEYRNDAVMVQYARFLLQQNLVDNAKAIVEKYRGGSDSSRGISVLYAMILGKKGDHAAAIDLLEQLRKTAPSTTAPTTMASSMPSTAPTTLASASPDIEPDLLIALGREYNSAGRFSEAMDLATDLIKRGVDTADVYLIQAGAFAGTKKWTEAKTAVETALQRNATSRECFDMQRSIADGMGQNDKALYSKAVDAVAIPDQVFDGIPSQVATPAIADAQGAYYVARIGAVAYEAGKDFRATEFQRIKAVTRQGGERLSAFDFHFSPSIESIYINKAEIKDAAGKVVYTAKPEDAFVIDAPSDNAGVQKKILRVGVTGLAPDCTLDLVVTRKLTASPAHMKFTRYFMSAPMLVQRNAFVMRTSDLTQIHDFASTSIDKKTYGDAVCWQLDNPPIYRAEPIQTEPSNFLPVVIVGDAKTTWEQIGDEYLAALKNVLVDDAECRTLATRLISGRTSDQDKVDAIALYIQKEITNKYNEFATNDRVPRKPADVIRDKSGDSKDQALLFYQLLRAAGFDEARLALVSRSDKIEADKASLDQFDHIVVCLPPGANGTEPRFLDCTEKDSKIESPPDTIAGSKALVLKSGGSALIDIAPMPADASRIKTVRQITMDGSNGVLTIHDVMELGGPAAALWRAPLKSLKPEEQKLQIQNVMARAQVPADITKLEFTGLNDPEKPLVVDITYTSSGAFQQQQNAVVGRLPATWERHWLIPPQLNRRLTPFYLRVPMKIETELTFRLPEKVKLANTLTDGNVTGKYGTLKSNYTVKPGEINGKTEIHTTAGRYEMAAYPEFLQSRVDLIDNSQPPIALQAGQ